MIQNWVNGLRREAKRLPDGARDMATIVENACESVSCGVASQVLSTEVRPGVADVRFLIRIENHLHIAVAFGRPVADTVLEQAGLQLDVWLAGQGSCRSDRDNGSFHVHTQVPDEDDRIALSSQLAATIRDFCISAQAVPLRCAGQIIHLALSWGQMLIDDCAFLPRRDRLAFVAQASRREDLWCAGYREDMSGVAAGFADMAQDRLWLNWQSILPAQAGRRAALYQEALLCHVDPASGRSIPFQHAEAMERAGFVRALDQWFVGKVLDQMDEVRFLDLGIRTSAQSMVVDGWWAGLLDRLRDQGDHARRVVFVISGASPFPALSDAAAFVRRVRSLGCRIALDGFGNGFASIQTLFALAPDIVKIDGAFAGWAAASDRGRKILDHAVALAGATGAQVVVNGISTARQKVLALGAGADWLQGDHIDRPAIGLSWRDDPRPSPVAYGQ